ncbi:DegT/DnrJ/EryC1/StrS family aminotransferase [Nubsella zeaxanthinifaciens]|uniref:DegT/DnrJ/EryC1/StrS family aminotransferase n=1 Tax=Nubsella zeaxanthinifaciens TaxID=392412 RepID=UPI003D017823
MLGHKLKVPFFDASANYNLNKIVIDEALQKVLEGGAYINGAEVELFAQHLATYLNVSHVIPCANGTDALCLALMALELQRGDEVIVPAFNFIAAAEAVAHLGFVPVFADVDPDSFNICANSIEEKITSKTRAIIVVHLFGAAASMDAILNIANKYQVPVIEDVAQSLGGEYNGKQLGTLGSIGCTSFFPTKNLACFGDGGAVFSAGELLASKIKMLANHGQEKKYVHKYIGINSRLDTLQAAVLICQLKVLNQQIEKRRALAVRYADALRNLPVSLPNETIDIKHSFNQYCIKLSTSEQRNSLKEYLEQQDISTMVYYSSPNHLQEAFASFGYKKGDFPVAEQLCQIVLALPIFPALTFNHQDYVIEHIKSFFGND